MYKYGAYSNEYLLDPAYADDLDSLYDRLAANKSKLRSRHSNSFKNSRTADPYDDFWDSDAMSRNQYTDAVKQAAGTAADVGGDAVVDALTDKGKGGFLGKTKNNLSTAWGNIKAGKGAFPKYAKLANIGMAGYDAIKVANAFNEYNNAKGNTDDLVSDILASAGGNPNLRYDLSTDQLDTLRRLQNGTYDLTGDFDASSLMGSLGNIATGAGLGFVTGGGPVGAILGGLGGVIDGVSSGIVGNQERITADLQGLYAALQEAEMRNKSMKRDAAMQRYANSLYY